jgi:hypothetical protein
VSAADLTEFVLELAGQVSADPEAFLETFRRAYVTAQRGDAVAQLAVVDAQPADPVAQPRLGPGDVRQQAVRLGGVAGPLRLPPLPAR